MRRVKIEMERASRAENEVRPDFCERAGINRFGTTADVADLVRLSCRSAPRGLGKGQRLETNMSGLRYPNESREYRDARDSLLRDEQELIDKVKSVAEKRRNLPPGGQLKEDYVFQWANDGKVGKSVKFSELFSDKNTLLLYSFMYGPNWDNPCPSCTSLVDGFDRTWYQVTQSGAAFVAIAKAPGRSNQCVGQTTWMVANCACFRIGLYLSIRLQMPGRL